MLLVLMTDGAVGVVGQKTQRVLPRAKVRGILDSRWRLVRADRRIERHEPARVTRDRT